jgi:predicted DNA-binding transcriptional regulator YafY
MVYYRDNWYFDAWDELRNALRTFSVDRIVGVTEQPDSAVNVSERELDDQFVSSYGIFSGKANKTAVLRFSAERARWVADERWHSQQIGQFQMDGTYELRISYRESHELLMDILRHGTHVEVVSPDSLRAAITQALESALARYLT